MARPRSLLEPLVHEIVANNETWGAEKIRRELERLKEKWSWPPGVKIPEDRTLTRMKGRLREEERQAYRYFRWPDAMQSGALPWEASGACLRLLAKYIRHGGGAMRPTIGTCRWYWKLTLADSPALPEEGSARRKLARRLAALEAAGQLSPDILGAVEALLALGSLSDYEVLAEQGEVPAWDFLVGRRTAEEMEALGPEPMLEFGEHPDEMQEAIIQEKGKGDASKE